MAEKKINPMLKMALELGPVVAFFIAYVRMKDLTYEIAGTSYAGFIVATAGFVPLMVASTLILWRLSGKISRMQITTLILVIVFGGMSVWFNDERFFKIKPTIVYALFGSILAIGLLRGQSYLKFVMEEMMPLQEQGWMVLTKRLTYFFFGLAAFNEAVWRTQSTEAWVYIETFAMPAAMFVFFMTQGKIFETYALQEAEAEAPAEPQAKAETKEG